MNSLEVLNTSHRLSVQYVGVYLADRLPRMWTRSAAIVANTDDHNQHDQHWVAFYIDEHGTGTYFDNYGLPPLHSRFLLRLRRNSTTYRCKEYFLKLAGNTAVYFMCLYFMCNGYNLSQFLNLFASDCKRNDRLIVQLFLSSSTTLYSLYRGENESDSELSYEQCT